MSRILQSPVHKTLISMAFPASIGMLLTFFFQLVDTYFVGQLGTSELAAIGFSYPIYILIIGLFMGIGSGISSTVGKAIGENKLSKAQVITASSLILFVLITLLIGMIGYLSVRPVFQFLGAAPAQIALIKAYMQPLYLGMFFLVATLIGNAALMARGIMIKTTVIMAIGGIANLIFDYLLIFGKGPFPALELQGAALATIISWSLTSFLMLTLLYKEELLSLKAFKNNAKVKQRMQEVLKIGTPAVVAQTLNPIAIALITKLVSQSGENAIAAYGIVTRIESLGLTGILALSVILTPLVAQNFGAKQQSRLDEIIAYSGRMTTYWGLLLFAALLVFGKNLTHIFSQNPEVVSHAQNYFFIIGLSFPAFGLALISTSFFNGVYQAQKSLHITLVKSLLLSIPFAFIGSLFSLSGIWIGIALANILGAAFAGRLLKQWLAEQGSELAEHSVLKDYLSDFRMLLSKVSRAQS